MLVYLSGPITGVDKHTMKQNIQEGRDVFFRLLADDIHALCPHLTSGYVSGITYDQWMSYAFSLIEASTHVFMLPRWESSKGACQERIYAYLNKKPVLYDIQEVYDRKDQ